MATRLNRSVEVYLQRKQLFPDVGTTLPLFMTGAPHPHDEPVETVPVLLPVRVPSEVVTTS